MARDDAHARQEQCIRLLAALYKVDVAHYCEPGRGVLKALDELAARGLATARTTRCDQTARLTVELRITEAGKSHIETMLIDDAVARRLSYREQERMAA